MPRRFSVQHLALSRRHARWGRPYFQQFFGAMAPRPASSAPSPCLNFAAIKHLVVAAITKLVVHRALPFDERI
jgi:hypothetical protein